MVDYKSAVFYANVVKDICDRVELVIVRILYNSNNPTVNT